MFGPNSITDFERTQSYHHRSQPFHDLLAELESAFVEKFGLQDYDILFLTGNGTLANEAVIYSLRYPVVAAYPHLEFGHRLAAASDIHCFNKGMRQTICSAYVAYETSVSRFSTAPKLPLVFADMVSAFPYYLPKKVDIFTTVSSKQLGAIPVLGIVGIRKGLNVFREEEWSALSIAAHLRFRSKHETMTTPAIPLYVDLLRAVREFDRDKFIEKIDRRRELVVDAVGKENVIGEGPVVTLREGVEVDGAYPGSAGQQIFLWSGTDLEYQEVFG